MMLSEKQSVAGQWRALARKYLVSDEVSTRLGDHLAQKLRSLLWQAAILSGMRPTADYDPQTLIRVIIGKVLKIRHLIGEAMISSDYHIIAPQSGTEFDAREMEDVYVPRGKKRPSGPQVMCCVALGLKRVEKVEGRLRSEMLVKPEVGLQTLLADLGLEVAGTRSENPAAR